MRLFIICMIILFVEVHAGCSRRNSETVGSQSHQNTVAQPTASPALSTPETEFDEPALAARNALSNLKNLLTIGKNFREMGFDTIEEVDQASMGDPAPVYLVGLDQLREYSSATNAQSLLVDTHRIVFPVMAGGRGRTLITVELRDGKWRFVSFSDQNVARNLVKVREDKSGAPGGVSSSNYFVVQVKALFLTFLAHREPGAAEGSSLRLVPLNGKTELKISPAFREDSAFLEAHPNFNAEDEATMKASVVFGALANTAKKIDSSKPF